MKTLYSLFALIILLTTSIYSQEPTYAGLPDSSQVLVVYNSLSQISIDVKDYYKNARGIPESNIVDLDSLFDDDIYDPETRPGIQLYLIKEKKVKRN